jgi:hypothetical protein
VKKIAKDFDRESEVIVNEFLEMMNMMHFFDFKKYYFKKDEECEKKRFVGEMLSLLVDKKFELVDFEDKVYFFQAFFYEDGKLSATGYFEALKNSILSDLSEIKISIDFSQTKKLKRLWDLLFEQEVI